MINVLSYLEQSAKSSGDKIAFADIEQEVSFEKLEKTARQVGTALAQKLPPRSPAVFYGEKSAFLMCGFLGAVYAGCFYVLIDPKHPVARVKAILSTLGTSVVICEEKYRAQVGLLGVEGEILVLEELAKTEENPKKLAQIRTKSIDIDPLYAIFTSGSTGVPKGVVVSHRSTIDFIDNFTETFGITSEDVIANQAPFDFDVSVKDIYSGLKTGATVAIIPRSYFSFPTKLMDFLCEKKATTLIWAVSALCFVTTMNGLSYKTPKTLKKIMFSGEVMPIKHLNKWREALPNATYVNLYGPTEITCNCMYYILDREFTDSEVLPLGVNFANEKVFLLGENGEQVTASGELGEICVSGTALSLGYFGDREKTDKVFVQNPLNKFYNEQIYCTGDLARYGEDGNLYYVTRKDFQIKHMGHRIELGEIETAINSVEGVNRTCCVYLEEKQKVLAFYDGGADKKQITAAIKTTLPAFMLPNVFVKLDTLPMTKNGKIDRAKLKQDYLATKG
ncbi:MAG: amino acid adenylation domain-containing protein [Oscillospiraceae bacterium]